MWEIAATADAARARLGTIAASLAKAASGFIERERHQLPLWLPVCFAAGVAA